MRVSRPVVRPAQCNLARCVAYFSHRGFVAAQWIDDDELERVISLQCRPFVTGLCHVSLNNFAFRIDSAT